jgi:hypothetical protein
VTDSNTVLPTRTIKYGGGCLRKKILKGLRSNKKSIIIVKAERILFWLWWFAPSLYYKIAYYKGL